MLQAVHTERGLCKGSEAIASPESTDGRGIEAVHYESESWMRERKPEARGRYCPIYVR